MRNAAGLPQGTVKMKPVRLGGGGFCTGFSISNDGVTQAARIDVFGAYIKSTGDTVWRQAFTTDTLSIGDYPGTAGYVAPDITYSDSTDGGPGGCNEMVVAPSDNQRLYAVWNARLWKSADAGKSWTHLTGMPDFHSHSNSGTQPHNNGPNMAIDPQNPNVFLLGTSAAGLNYSTDGGTTITNVSLGTNGTLNGWQIPNKIACDPTGTVTGGISQRWFAWLQGTGGYVSTTGPGGPWTYMSTSPLWATDIVFDKNGNCWAADPSTSSNLWRCAAGGTTWVNAPGSAPALSGPACTIAVDPQTGNHVVVMDGNGEAIVSTNGGTSWLGGGPYSSNFPYAPTINLYAYSVPWLGFGQKQTFNPGVARFDPVTSGKLWCSAGVGMYSCTAPTTYDSTHTTSQFNWIECSEGIENMVSTTAVEPLGGEPLFGVWDRAVWRVPDLDHSPHSPNLAPPGTYGTNPSTAVQACWDIGIASDDPTWVAALINFGGQHSGFSTDGWQTVSAFPTTPPNDALGGCICVGPKNNVLVVQTHACPYYTKNGGSAWSYVNVPGLTASFTGHIDNGSGAAGTTLTVTGINFGTISTGMSLSTNGASGSITGQLTGTAGGIGTYSVSTSQLVASTTIIGCMGAFGATNDYFVRKNACYDALAGKYYMSNYGPTGSASLAGIWSTSDLAGAWTQTFTGTIWTLGTDGVLGADDYNTKLRWVPGQEGNFFICAGHDQAVTFKRSTDGCATFQNVKVTADASITITQVSDFAFGKSAPGQTYPAIYFFGYVNSVRGLYRSDDNFATAPKLLQQYPGTLVDLVVAAGASPNIYGRVYVGFQGSSFVYGDYDCEITLS